MESPVANIYIWAALITAATLFTTKRQWVAIVVGVLSLVLMRHFLPL
jgi:branched-subunit amino acid transport protein